ncbi:VWA domain-containing protein [Actinocorallia lasiicapitis]
MTLLGKGQNLSLPAADLDVRLAWTVGGGREIDVSALLVGASGKVSSDDDFVFYNQPEAAAGAVRLVAHGPGIQGFAVRPGALPESVDRVVLAASVDSGTFAGVAGVRLGVWAQDGPLVAEFPVDGLTTETLILLGEIYRRTRPDGVREWKVRAVGQGYDTGLAGLATDYGVTIEPPTPPPPAQPPHTHPQHGQPTPPQFGQPPQALPQYGQPGSPQFGQPSQGQPYGQPPQASQPQYGQGVSGVGREGDGDVAGLPVEMRKRVSLSKQAAGVVLEKKGLVGVRARVGLVLDGSGSMAMLYSRGTVGRVVERMAAVAAQLSVDGSMAAWAFASDAKRLPALRVPELAWWIDANVKLGTKHGLTENAPKRGLRLKRDSLGFANNEPAVIRDLIDFYRQSPPGPPVLVLFFSDGGIYKDREISQLLIEASHLPIFWQFIGLGNANYGVLERFDTMPGRRVDNAGFFSVDDIDRISDPELYDRLLSEFPLWLRTATTAGIL